MSGGILTLAYRPYIAVTQASHTVNAVAPGVYGNLSKMVGTSRLWLTGRRCCTASALRDRRHLPTLAKRLTDTCDCASSLASSSPVLSLSSLPNSASMYFIHSCLEILPFLSVSMRRSNCLTSANPSATLSCGFGTESFCAAAVPSIAQIATDTAITMMTHGAFVRFNIITSYDARFRKVFSGRSLGVLSLGRIERERR